MKTLSIVARTILVVSSVMYVSCSAQADQNPNSPSAQAALRGPEWPLVELNGKPVSTTGKPPTLTLAANSSRASGFAGCNQFSGEYKVNADNLQLSSMVMTRMFCTETMDLEKQYVAALESTRAYRMTGPRLELLADGKVIAAFEKR
jgi:heat shock protein HslJ